MRMSSKETNSAEVKSRMQKRELKKQYKTTLMENVDNKKDKRTVKDGSANENKRIRVRLFPIWMRIVIIAVLFFLLVIIGAVIGYSVIGEGSFTEVFRKSTWTNIFDLVDKE